MIVGTFSVGTGSKLEASKLPIEGASASYNPMSCCGYDCFALGLFKDKPCWGDVSIVDERVHACEGHEDTYPRGEYKIEGK